MDIVTLEGQQYTKKSASRKMESPVLLKESTPNLIQNLTEVG